MTLRTRLSVLAVLVAACSSDSGGGADEASGTGGASTSGGMTTADASGGGTGAGECGNATRDGDEECDGSDLGGLACTDVSPAYDGGTLACGASCTFDASGCTIAPGTALVTLNELTSDSVLEGTYAGPNDAIELFNAGTADADISGWKLSDDPTLPDAKTYTFPSGTSLAAGEFLVLVSYDATAMTGDFPFGVSNNKTETITLADGDATVIDAVTVDGYLARKSYCRLPDGSGAWAQCEQTFGAVNTAATTACGNGVVEDGEACDSADLAGNTCAGLELGYTGGVLVCSPTCKLDASSCTTTSDLVINELESTNDDIELFNGGDADVDMSGWILTDAKVDASYDATVDDAELVFADGTTLAAGDYLVVALGVGAGQHPFGLDTQGDTVTLVDPGPPLTIIDQVTYEDGAAMTSYCRQPNGPGGLWMADCTPSMGDAN